MKQFIKNRIKEIEVKIKNNRDEVRRINDLPFVVKETPKLMVERRTINNRILSLEVASKLNKSILNS